MRLTKKLNRAMGRPAIVTDKRTKDSIHIQHRQLGRDLMQLVTEVRPHIRGGPHSQGLSQNLFASFNREMLCEVFDGGQKGRTHGKTT